MNKLIRVLCILLPVGAMAQDSFTEYYADRFLTKQVKPKQAQFYKAQFQWQDGTSCKEIVHQSGEIIRLEHYRGKEPIGKWLLPWGNACRLFDYDFELVYRNSCLKDSIGHLLPAHHNMHADEEAAGYEAPIPVLAAHQLARKIVYPPTATEDAAKGKVVIGYTLKEDGTITDVHVVQGIHPALDKEAMRIIRQMEYEGPALLKGQPVAVCLTQGLVFKLE